MPESGYATAPTFPCPWLIFVALQLTRIFRRLWRCRVPVGLLMQTCRIHLLAAVPLQPLVDVATCHIMWSQYSCYPLQLPLPLPQQLAAVHRRSRPSMCLRPKFARTLNSKLWGKCQAAAVVAAAADAAVVALKQHAKRRLEKQTPVVALQPVLQDPVTVEGMMFQRHRCCSCCADCGMNTSCMKKRCYWHWGMWAARLPGRMVPVTQLPLKTGVLSQPPHPLVMALARAVLNWNENQTSSAMFLARAVLDWNANQAPWCQMCHSGLLCMSATVVVA